MILSLQENEQRARTDGVSVNILIELDTIDAVCVPLKVDCCGFALLPPILQGTADEVKLLPILSKCILAESSRGGFPSSSTCRAACSVASAERMTPNMLGGGLLTPST